MELIEALNLFKLKIPYTEEELKNTYRRLIIQYHPDKHPESEKEFYEEKAKKINEAKRILYNHLNIINPIQSSSKKDSKQTYKNTNIVNVEKLKLKYLEKITSDFNEIKNVNKKDKLFKLFELKFYEAINNFTDHITSINTIEEVENLFKKYTNDFETILTEYIHTFCISSGINIRDTQNMTIKKTRECFLSIINNILQEELNKYINYSNFKEIHKLLITIQEEYTLSCLYGYNDIEEIKKNFHIKIKIEINNYTLRKKQLEELKTDKSIDLQIIKSLEESIIFEDKFNDIYKQINGLTKFKCKIRKLFSNE